MSEERPEESAEKIALLEQQLAAVTAERNLLLDQLGQAQEAALAAERRATAAETELKILGDQNQVSDGEVVITNDLPPPQPQSPPAVTSPPGTTSEENQSRLGNLWRWLWENNDRNADSS
jgi:hypothetical protein